MYILDWIREYRRDKYIQGLVSRGMTLGKNVFLNDGFFLDPGHCHLIVIEDDVVFGPGVKLFAHDASSLKVIGKTKVGLVKICRNSFIGADTVVLPGVTIGENSIVAAGSVVSCNITSDELWAGVPAKKLCSIEEYKNSLNELPQRNFPLASYSSELLNDEKREEMKKVLLKDRFAFMVRK